MNIESSPGEAATFVSLASSGSSAVIAETSVLMCCETCDLTGGPFPPAEAAYLRSIHDRVHHGYSAAA